MNYGEVADVIKSMKVIISRTRKFPKEHGPLYNRAKEKDKIATRAALADHLRGTITLPDLIKQLESIIKGV